jgi:hypothetical protein
MQRERPRLTHPTPGTAGPGPPGGADASPSAPDEFVKAAVSDEERQELLARALTIAQDAAMRDKRRALGRVVVQAASDIGKIDKELVS